MVSLVLAPEYILVSISPLEQTRENGISLNLTNFVAKGHAENTLGLKFNYCFLK
jgi:hypothetical protein